MSKSRDFAGRLDRLVATTGRILIEADQTDMSSSPKVTFARLPTTFAGLIRRHPPRPIHDRVNYRKAVEIADALAGQPVNSDQDDYLVVLSTLIERYEADTLSKRRRGNGLDMLRFVLAENGLGGADLARIIGVHRSGAYRILQGKREITTRHAKALCKRFGVSAGLFVR